MQAVDDLPIADQLIHKVFEHWASRLPDALALVSQDRALTYSEVDRAANRLAHLLLGCGVKPEDRVGIYAERSIEMVVAQLGVLKAGGAYVPLDPVYPSERIGFVLQDSDPAVVISEKALLGRLQTTVPIVAFGDEGRQPASRPAILGIGGRSLAYVMYTSGSTGNPKGVMIEHRSVLHLVVNSSYAPIRGDDCVAHCATPSFDASTWEIWAPLLNGARVAIVPQNIVLQPLLLNSVLSNMGVTALFLTTALFNAYVGVLDQAFGSLRHFLTGGDVINVHAVHRLTEKRTPPQHVLNVYGPTEATTFGTAFDIDRTSLTGQPIPIGRPIERARVYVLDELYRPVSAGSRGEIYIGGPGVARGYLNHPAMTAERFCPDPFGDAVGGRLYRTGDVGTRRSDDNIEFLGRNDFQLKIRGFRVEPGEVEAVLETHPGVRQALVMANQGTSGEKRLVAYVTGIDGAGVRENVVLELAGYLKERLPSHAVPAEIVLMDTFPLTINGKVDRNALRASGPRDHVQRRQYVAPNTPMEQRLAEMWKTVLHLQREVGLTDNFIELGGDSILGTKVSVMIAREFGVQLSALTLIQYPTMEELAYVIRQNSIGLQQLDGTQEYEQGLV